MTVPRLTEAEIDRLIEDDVPYGDLTTRLAGIGAQLGRIDFSARDPLTLSGVDEAVRILTRLGASIEDAADAGRDLEPGAMILTAIGPAAAVHAGWKVSQTLMEWASGIATATRRLVAAAHAVDPAVPVAVTRKSAPFTKKLALQAVLAGGGTVHRFGLSDSVMLFAEHRAFFDGDLTAAIALLRRRAPEQVVAVEVSSLDEALAARDADVIQLEKFAPETVRDLRARLPKRADGRPILAAAGGVCAANAAAYVAAGADVLVTSAPFQAKPTDIQVRITPM